MQSTATGIVWILVNFTSGHLTDTSWLVVECLGMQVFEVLCNPTICNETTVFSERMAVVGQKCKELLATVKARILFEILPELKQTIVWKFGGTIFDNPIFEFRW